MPNETLLTESTVILFGRLVPDLTYNPQPRGGTGAVATALSKGHLTQFARIYSFSYQNEYFDLASPALFLVPEGGNPVSASVSDTLLARIPPRLVTAQDLLFWEFQRDDSTIRLDIMSGSIGRILLDYELAEGGLQDIVRGGSQLDQPAPLGGRGLGRRARRWRSDDD